MKLSEKTLYAWNDRCRERPHPFNTANAGGQSYVEWEYQYGQGTIAFYKDAVTPEEMFRDKVVLDIGCGSAGKTMYFGSFGPKKLYGADIVAHYKEESEAFAAARGCADIFEFILGDAAALPLADNTVDTIIMNDAMEHVGDPLGVLREAYRVLAPGGRLYVNFPPFNHPFGAHLFDAIRIPYVHLFFDDETLIRAYKKLVADLPDAQMRIDLRIAADQNGHEYFSYLNKMSIRRFNGLVQQTAFQKRYYHIDPLRRYVAFLSRIPWLNEFCTRMVVCILEK